MSSDTRRCRATVECFECPLGKNECLDCEYCDGLYDYKGMMSGRWRVEVYCTYKEDE